MGSPELQLLQGRQWRLGTNVLLTQWMCWCATGTVDVLVCCWCSGCVGMLRVLYLENLVLALNAYSLNSYTLNSYILNSDTLNS